MEGFERPPTRRGASRGGRIPFFERHRRENARSAGANLSAEDLQRRLLAIGNAAKARNPDGFVDELKRRVGPSDGDDDDLETVAAPAAPPEPAASWFCLEPGTRLEKALARGDVTQARGVRAEATATLWKIAGDGALTDAWCRSLVREGADVGHILTERNDLWEGPWTKEKLRCVGYLALAAPHAAAASIVEAVRRRGSASSSVFNIAKEVNAALKRRGLPEPRGWQTVLAVHGSGSDLTTAERAAVLRALAELVSTRDGAPRTLQGPISAKNLRREAEAILGEQGALKAKKAAIKKVYHQEAEADFFKIDAPLEDNDATEEPNEEDTAALRATQKTLRAGARASELLKTLEKAAPEAAAKAETWTRAEAVARGDAAERARVEAEARAAKQRDALSARIADLETALARATQQAAAARQARAPETETAPADAAAQDVDDDSPRGVVEAIRRARLVDVDLSSCPAAVRAGARGLQASLAAAAERLAWQHIWRADVIAERFDWGRDQGIFAMAVRVRQLAAPMDLPMLDGYGGCKSWIELEPSMDIAAANPVLEDAIFEQKLAGFREALA